MKQVLVIFNIIFLTITTALGQTPSEVEIQMFLDTLNQNNVLRESISYEDAKELITNIDKKIPKKFLTEYDYYVEEGIDSLSFNIIAIRVVKTKPIKHHRTFGEIFLGHVGVWGGRISGGTTKEKWRIVIDQDSNQIINIEKERYRIIAKF